MVEFLIALAFLGGLISQTLQDSTLFIIFLIILFKQKLNSFRQTIKEMPHLLWLAISLLMVAFLSLVMSSYSTQDSYWALLKFSWIPNLIILVTTFKIKSPETHFDFEKFTIYVLSLSLIPSLYGLIIHHIGYDFYFQRNAERLLGMVNSATYHAHGTTIALSLITPYVINLIKSIFSKEVTLNTRSILIIISYFIFLYSLYATYTRGAIGAFIIALSLFSLLQYKITSIIKWWLLVFLIGFLIFKLDSLFQNRIQETSNLKSIDNLARKELFLTHWEMFRSSPWLGLGYDVYKKHEVSKLFTDKYSSLTSNELENSHAHNQYLQIASTMGILGFIVFMLILGKLSLLSFYLFKKVKKYTHHQTPISLMAWGGLTAWIAILLLFITDQTFEYAMLRTMIITIWSFILYLTLSRKDLLT